MSGSVLRSAMAWFAAAAVIAVGLGLASALLQQYFAPLGLYPVLLGLALGAGLAAALRPTQFGSRRWAMAGAVVAAAVMLTAQFYGSYRLYVAAVQAKAPAGVGQLPLQRLQPPDNLLAYLRQQARYGRPLFAGITARGGWAWATWIADWALAAATAAVVVRLGFRRPWCGKCHKWYRAVGEGQLTRSAASQIGKLADVALPRASGRYRVWTCPTAGHGTTLEITWTAQGQKQPAAQLIAIPPAKAAELQAILAGQSERGD